MRLIRRKSFCAVYKIVHKQKDFQVVTHYMSFKLFVLSEMLQQRSLFINPFLSFA